MLYSPSPAYAYGGERRHCRELRATQAPSSPRTFRKKYNSSPRPTHQPSYIARTHAVQHRPSSVKHNVETIFPRKNVTHCSGRATAVHVAHDCQVLQCSLGDLRHLTTVERPRPLDRLEMVREQGETGHTSTISTLHPSTAEK